MLSSWPCDMGLICPQDLGKSFERGVSRKPVDAEPKATCAVEIDYPCHLPAIEGGT